VLCLVGCGLVRYGSKGRFGRVGLGSAESGFVGYLGSQIHFWLPFSFSSRL
jgi:hypothetical protein